MGMDLLAVLADLFEDIFAVLFTALGHEHAEFDKVRGLHYVDSEELILALLASPEVHLSEDLESALLGARDLRVHVDEHPFDTNFGMNSWVILLLS